MDTLLWQILSRNGINPDRDVAFMNMGGSPERYNALGSGNGGGNYSRHAA